MNYTELRKLSLKSFIGFLGLTALIAILSVLSGEFGDFQLKILATCFTISAASIGSMSCAAFIEKKKRAGLGLTGIALAVAAATLVIAGVWAEVDREDYWKTTITFIIFAVAFAHAFLLALPELSARQRWVQGASSVSIGLLALLITAALWGGIDDEGFYRFLAVVSIIVGLETLVVPILMKLRKGNGETRRALILKPVGDDLYEDAAGKVYRVTEVNPEPDEPAEAEEPPADSGASL